MVRGILYFMICIVFLPNIILYIQGDTQLDSYLPTSLALIGTLVAFYFISMYVVKEFFCDSIKKFDNKIKLIPSKYSRKEAITYDLRAMDRILFEKVGSNNQYASEQYVIWFVDKSGKRHAVIDKFAMDLGGKEITEFIFELSEMTGLAVTKVGW